MERKQPRKLDSLLEEGFVSSFLSENQPEKDWEGGEGDVKIYAESVQEVGQLVMQQFSERKYLRTLSESCLGIKIILLSLALGIFLHMDICTCHFDEQHDNADKHIAGSDKMFTFCI